MYAEALGGLLAHELLRLNGTITASIGEALRFRLRHDDLTHYNAVQKVLYLGVMIVLPGYTCEAP
jgi:thiosulfate reductase cytochrome b subunit